jgi:antirestriction protein ArdC
MYGDMRGTYQKITDQVIKAIESGDVLPWRKPWKSKSPCNALTGRPYRGINRFVLSMSEYTDHRWLTFNQAKNASGSVKRGEQGSSVMLWSDVKDEDTGKERLVCRAFTVFNVEQCEGVQLPDTGQPQQESLFGVEGAEAIVQGYKDSPAIHVGAEFAAYYPRQDHVVMPHMRDFESPEAYFATLMHELVHSTAHPTRLNRSIFSEHLKFGSESYGAEEILAEIGAAFLCSEAGIDNIVPCTGYVASWLLKALRNDSSYIVRAASQAQKAADWILGTYHHDDTPTAPTRLTDELVAV